ncbi:Os04g0303200 [Oryza sativa Japonica Group]|uniref:Os04g0303200 protein n=1 Tax=Oryza sativa subsp. japonica TaxID=39947 RepID=Q0JEB2_ORYSJ|nr:Os04g0303200 [Oryza sativa Japonica Group]|eukprot:NP_001052411.1 Os04g0303200 [Oryza sativa Japonica Group]
MRRTDWSEVPLDQMSLPLAFSRRTRSPSPVSSRVAFSPTGLAWLAHQTTRAILFTGKESVSGKMKTAKMNSWQGGVQKNPAANERSEVCGDRRTMARTNPSSYGTLSRTLFLTHSVERLALG